MKLQISIITKYYIGASKMHLGPLVIWAAVRSKVVVLLLLICCLICFPLLVGSVFVFVLLCVALCHFWFHNHLGGELMAGCLLLLSYRCFDTISVMWLFLAVPWVGLQYVIMVFPDRTHFLFYDMACLLLL